MSVKPLPNLYIIGPMGAGKTTVGKALASLLHMDFLDSDQELERTTGVDIQTIFDLEGEAGFRRREQKIISQLTTKRNLVIDRKSTRLNSSHTDISRMPSSA